MKKKKKVAPKPKLSKTILALVLLILLTLLIRQLPSQPLQLSFGNKRVANKKIEISGVKMADFYQITNTNGLDTEEYKTIAYKKGYYHLFYFAPEELFIISIQRYPFDEIRPIAEQEFLKTLAIGEEDACKLNVELTTPGYANPGKAGKTYSLSFCK